MPNKLNNLASLGRYGDTMLAHINPQEAALLKSMGGSGTINPQTGLREFFSTALPSYTPALEPLPSLGQALDSASLQNLATQLNTTTVPAYSIGGMGAMSPAHDQIASQYTQYADLSPALGMGGGRQVQGYTIPSDQTFQGKPLEAKYDTSGNFQYLGLAGGDYLPTDPNQPNIVSSPRINAKGEIIDYGVFDLSKQSGAGFGDLVRDVGRDFAPMILAGLGANFAAGNFGTLGGGAAAGSGALSPYAAQAAGAYGGSAAAAAAAAAGSLTGIQAANAAQNALTQEALGRTGLTYGGNTTPADINGPTTPTPENPTPTVPGGSADKAAIFGAGGYGPLVSPAELAGGAGLLSSLGSVGSGIGSTLGSILGSGTGLGSLIAGAGNVASGVISGNAAKDAAQIQADAAIKAAQIQQDMFNTVNAQGAPYRASGYNALNQIGSMLPGQYSKYDVSGKLIGTDTGSGYLTQQYGPEQFQKDIDPGYAFRLQQGQMANQRASNLAGGLIGGNALKGMQDYTQGMASQEYGNAFNRFQTQRGNIYNTLASIAGIGQTAQGQANTLAQNNATAQGQLGVGSAAATAAGKVGQATGYGNALTGAGNAILLSTLLGQNQGVAGNSGGSNFMNAYNAIG